MENQKIKYNDYQLVEDLKELVKNCDDVKYSENIEEKVESFGLGTLLKVTKEIEYGVKVLDVQEVTEDNVLEL